jgi:hypothetical protein
MVNNSKKTRSSPAPGGSHDSDTSSSEDTVGHGDDALAGAGDSSDDGNAGSDSEGAGLEGDDSDSEGAGLEGDDSDSEHESEVFSSDDEDEVESSRRMFEESVASLKRKLGAVGRQLRKLGNRKGKQLKQGTKAYRARVKLERRLAGEHADIAKRLVDEQRGLNSLLQLQRAGVPEVPAVASTRHRSFTKPPPRGDDEPELRLTVSLERREIEEFITEYEYWMSTTHKFPRKEAKDGVTHHRWSNLLPSYIDNKSKEDKLFFRRLCGDCGEPWKKVKKKLLKRFAKSDNWLAPASYLDKVFQKEGQSATSYCEAFAAAVDKSILIPQSQPPAAVASWKRGHTYYPFKLLEHADPKLRRTVTKHKKIQTA